jgi:predicted amidohydrolase
MVGGTLDPSAALGALAERIHRWEESGTLGATWLDDASDRLTDWAREAHRLRPEIEVVCAAARTVLACDPDDATLDRFAEAARWLQRLDDWHAPLRLGAGAATPLTDLQEVSLRRLQVDGEGYNGAGTSGTVIPAAASGVSRPRSPSTGVVAQLLHSTAYLPASTAAGDPDDPKQASSRVVELRYVAASTRSGDPRGDVGDRPLVSVAPVLQQEADAKVERRIAPDRYGVRITYDPARLDDILGRAVADGAHLLFMPEMAVDADRRADLASAIRRTASAHRRATGSLPQLRFVVAGVSHSSGGTGNNSIVVMDLEGRSILEQDKLCRWNLKWYHQLNYAVGPACVRGDPDLKEDIPGGRLVWIADLAHLGRFLTLICADMDYDKPGDWLVRNVAVDWLHAPIMDKSIAWHRNAGGGIEPWIVERANRAADNGVPKVVVTNSILLTLSINDYNARHGPHPVYTDCTIAFMLDSTGTSKAFRQIDVPVPTPAPPPIVRTVRWLDGFTPFPPSA